MIMAQVSYFLFWPLCNLDLGTSLSQLGLGCLSISFGGTFQHSLGQSSGEILDLVHGNASNVTDNLVDANL
jgi:hypothetical protein